MTGYRTILSQGEWPGLQGYMCTAACSYSGNSASLGIDEMKKLVKMMKIMIQVKMMKLLIMRMRSVSGSLDNLSQS